MGTLLEKFEEHEGPVRGVDFHLSQPLFVSGGDDYKIKVWNYKQKRCLFTLLGHLDYIRTVQFHHENPWILSASDDQTVRIWNWQSRNCIAVLTGHNHYVMSAAFHPKEDLIVSASLDQTVRVWDTSGLRKKTVRGAPGATPAGDDGGMASRMHSDLFGGTDAVVKYVLEGHDRGVNWASFHPSLPLIISGADDRVIKLWRMNETKAWEVDTMRGHGNNVSCVIFHPRKDLIISNSEDRSIRVWDMMKRMGVQTMRKELDRFWILAAHPTQNLMAAGHDSGMIVFKLERERPAAATWEDTLFYVRDKYLRMYTYSSNRDVPIISLRRSGVGSALGQAPRMLVYSRLNPAEHCVLVCSGKGDSATYELVVLPKDSSVAWDHDSVRGPGLAAVFVGRNRFAVLEANHTIVIKNFRNEVTKKYKPGMSGLDYMFYGGCAGRLLLRADDRLVMFETQSKRVLAQVHMPTVKYVVWNKDCSLVALLGKRMVRICTRDMEMVCEVRESVRVKGAAWDADGVLIYTTLNHIKYLLPTRDGDSGIVRTLSVPIYICSIEGQKLHCLDRQGKTRTMKIDTTEHAFKLALQKQRYSQVLRMVRSKRLCGRSIVKYLQQKGFPEVALLFVDDEKTRFNLALECGSIAVALTCAMALDTPECWQRLSREALRQGDLTVVEMAYKKTKATDRLAFLHLITGDTDKLRKQRSTDVMAQFHKALMLGDVEERISILESVGQWALAYLAAAIHGLTETADRLRDMLTAADMPVPDLPASPQLLQPPTPIMREGNWPLLSVTKSVFERAVESAARGEALPGDSGAAGGGGGGSLAFDGGDDDSGGAWAGGDDDLDDLDLDGEGESKGAGGSGGGDDDDDMDAGDAWPGGDDDLDDLDLDDIELPEDAAAGAGAGAAGSGSGAAGGSSADLFRAPAPGVDAATRWCKSSAVPADHVAAGSFESAMQLLNRQLGIVSFQPLKPLFTAIYTSAYAFQPALPSTYGLLAPLSRTPTLPRFCLTLSSLVAQLKLAYKLFHAGKFSKAEVVFRTVLQSVPLLAVERRAEVNEAKELVGICREYLTAVRLEAARKAEADPARALLYAALFTHCNLQPPHLLLSLRLAMTCAYKLRNYIDAASFAQRLLDLPEASLPKNEKLATKARKVLHASQQRGRNEHDIGYDPLNPFVIDCATLMPIYKGSPTVRAPLCGSAYSPESEGAVCSTCQLTQVGLSCVGLVITNDSR
eukprot:PLAT12454.9.p1 GENE.PLAT12454.9~~PLAT12454.9.p1  ORF type:complete len:1289 (-),score=800.57 PLAT12454.9:76-3744(-)